MIAYKIESWTRAQQGTGPLTTNCSYPIAARCAVSWCPKLEKWVVIQTKFSLQLDNLESTNFVKNKDIRILYAILATALSYAAYSTRQYNPA